MKLTNRLNKVSVYQELTALGPFKKSNSLVLRKFKEQVYSLLCPLPGPKERPDSSPGPPPASAQYLRGFSSVATIARNLSDVAAYGLHVAPFFLSCPFLSLFSCLVFGCLDWVSLCSPGCSRIYFIDQAGFEFRDPLASASQVLGLKLCGLYTPWSSLTL